MLPNVKYKISKDMKDKINDLLLKMQTDENCIGETANALLNLYSVSESYIKCWNCKQFEQTGINTMGNEVGNCKLNECKVSHPKWQKCGEYEQCGNFR